jgi:predicted metallopeptidase
MAKEVVMEILNPKVEKLSKAEKLKIDAAAVSKERALKQIKTNSKKR